MEKFTENTRVKFPTIKHLMDLGYQYLSFKGVSTSFDGQEIKLDKTQVEPQTNILTDVFKKAYLKLNSQRTESDFDRLLAKIITTLDNNDLGKQFYREIFLNPDERVIDLSSERNFIANNTFQVMTELTCGDVNMDNFRPDITVFVNGLPLVFIEVKKSNNSQGIQAETDRMKTRFQNRAFRRYLNITQMMIFSNDMEYALENRPPEQGAYYATIGRRDTKYSTFREDPSDLFPITLHYHQTLAADEVAMLEDNNVGFLAKTTNSDYKLNCNNSNTPTKRICNSLLSFERLFFILRYGIAYADYSFGKQKHIIRYPQMFAIKAIEKMLEQGKQKGIVWHTQGSGKTALAYFSIKYLTDYYKRQGIIPQFFFIVDRIDLLLQAQMEFSCRGLKVNPVQSKEDFKKIISSPHITQNLEGLPEITVVNIQKFSSDSRALSKNAYNLNVKRIYFIDEAHRAYNPKGCFLSNLISSDTQAIRIALTGTPIIEHDVNTKDIFGDYIHTYYYNQSISDGYTLRLMREKISSDFRGVMQEKLKDIEVNKKHLKIKDIYTHQSYAKPMLEYIVNDLMEFRQTQQDPSLAGMLVCHSKDQAKILYRLFLEKYTDPSEVKRVLDEGEEIIESALPEEIASSKNLIAPNGKLRAALILSDTDSKEIRKEWIELFKEGRIDLLIVYQMLQTGFDSPRLKKLYLHRLVKEHNLLQTLTRVNRPYKNLKFGYIVDFADIETEYNKTNSRYQKELNEELGSENADNYNRLFVSEDEAVAQLQGAFKVLHDFDLQNPTVFARELDLIDDLESLVKIKESFELLKNINNMLLSQGSEEQEIFNELFSQINLKEINDFLKADKNRIIFLSTTANSQESSETRALLFTALKDLEFSFKGGSKEILELAEQYKETVANLENQFKDNIDPSDPEYIGLYEGFLELIRKNGMVNGNGKAPGVALNLHTQVNDLRNILKRLKELNEKDTIRASYYRGDRKFVRVEKRIESRLNSDHNQDYSFSKEQQKVVDALNFIKIDIDERCLNNEDLINNEGYFDRMVKSSVTRNFKEVFGSTTSSARAYVTEQICREYRHDLIGTSFL